MLKLSKNDFVLTLFLLCFYYCQSNEIISDLPNEEIKSNFTKKKFPVNEDKIQALKNNYESWLKYNYTNKTFPSIVTGIVQGNSLVYSYKLGATDTTNFSLGSITKIFTSTMVMKSIEKGLIKLNNPASFYFPNLKLENPILESKPILIKNLLSHTAGLPDLRYYKEGKYLNRNETGLSFNISEQIYPAGFHYRYSNHGFQLLGEILQKVHKKPLQEIIQDEIFTPIGMENSIAAKNVTGAGGIQTNLIDISRFAMMWLNEGRSYKENRILKNKTVNYMFEPVTNIPPSKTKKYCALAWRVERDEDGVNTFFHIGGANYTAAWIQIFPKYDIAVFYLSNPKEYDDFLMSQLITMQHKLGELATEIVGEKKWIHKTENTFPNMEMMNLYEGNYISPMTGKKAKVILLNEKIYFEFENKNKYSIPFYTINVTSGPGGQGAYEFAYDPITKKILGFSTFDSYYKKVQ